MAAVIPVDGVEYGTAAEIAAQLGADVTPAMVRNWARRDGLVAYRLPGARRGEVRYPLPDAARIEAEKRRSGRGRARRLDVYAPGHA
jgi:hypothetical protein